MKELISSSGEIDTVAPAELGAAIVASIKEALERAKDPRPHGTLPTHARAGLWQPDTFAFLAERFGKPDFIEADSKTEVNAIVQDGGIRVLIGPGFRYKQLPDGAVVLKSAAEIEAETGDPAEESYVSSDHIAAIVNTPPKIEQ